MTELVVTRGIPASGKTTWARAWVAEDEEGRCRVNRDDLRQNLYGRDAPLPSALEEALTTIQHAGVAKLLQTGRSVVVDDMHLRRSYVERWRAIAEEQGAELVVVTFEHVPLETCISRDRARAEDDGGRHVGEAFIREAHQRLSSSLRTEGGIPPTEPDFPPYVADPSLTPAWIVDVDGTLAVARGRGPFEWHRVGEDDVNVPVASLARALVATGVAVLVVSGRDAVCRPETEAWLDRHGIRYNGLYMRPRGDQRRDATVKREILEVIGEDYAVVGVLDDRDQVVKMWRAAGLPCLQVAPGDF